MPLVDSSSNALYTADFCFYIANMSPVAHFTASLSDEDVPAACDVNAPIHS